MKNNLILSCKHIRKGTTDHPILEDVNLELFQSEIIGILGASGTGKSTLLRLLNRLDDADAGDIFFHGQNIQEIPVPEYRRRVAMVFQQPIVLSGNVRSNFKIIEEFSDIRLEQNQCEKILDLVNLPITILDKDASVLSGGELQRMALARTLLNEP
ncbi:MAG: ATP-binding cassette domain-containing protein, partial [Candidatus Marinimicrobia bacterium]|nr:ATP-binding cassette domain-containing protein [Candidatus Neomarinimicrobiota bacterium]